MMDDHRLKNILEAALVAAGRPLSIAQLEALFLDGQMPGAERLHRVLAQLRQEYEGRGVRIVEVSTGFRIQTAGDVAPWVSRLWEERPPRYSRALLETLALVAYRQPITRGEIEDVRGVAVGTNIVRTLLERDWIRVVGHRDVPGRPAMYGTTREFLDYFGLKSLDELPTLAQLRDIESLNAELDLRLSDGAANDAGHVDPSFAEAETETDACENGPANPPRDPGPQSGDSV